MTENEKIELFDKWYDENYDEWAEGEEGIALREELEQAFKDGIEALEKENAELKERNAELRGMYVHSAREAGTYKQFLELKEKENAELKKELKDANKKVVHLACNQNKDLKRKINKAKEIIREFVEWANWQGNSKCPSFKSIQNKAEQFLSEVENV